MGALVVILLAATLLLPAHAYAAPLSAGTLGPVAQEYTYSECSRADEAAVHAEMTALAHTVLIEGRNGLEIDELVASAWHTTNADASYDAAVDAGIARIQAERSYWERLWSGWWADKATEFANQVAAYTFEDAAFNAKLEELSTIIANGLVVELQSASARSASSALLCLQSYVGEQYSTTLFNAFQMTLTQEIATDLELSHNDAIHISPVEMHRKGLVGVSVIVATQITRRMATALTEKLTQRLAGRIAGRVLGRLGSSAIPYLGWLVGAGLVAWDLWEGSNGALPEIREALQAEEVKADVRLEITKAVSEGVTSEVDTLASTVATTLVGQWHAFCANHGVVCQMAADNEDYRTLLDTMPVTGLTRLVQLTDFFWSEVGPEEVPKAGQEKLALAVEDGSLAKLLAAPPEADLILGWSGSPATTLAWVDLAGEQLPQVVELRLHETIDPHRMRQLSLAALLAIDDNSLIHKLRLLPTDALLTVLQLPTKELTQIATTATPEQLTWLAGYLATLPLDQVNDVGFKLGIGEMTIADLQERSLLRAELAEAANDKSVTFGGGDAPIKVVVEDGMAGAPSTSWAVVPQVASWWSYWSANSIAVAAAVILLLLVAVGVALALRRQMTEPPL